MNDDSDFPSSFIYTVQKFQLSVEETDYKCFILYSTRENISVELNAEQLKMFVQLVKPGISELEFWTIAKSVQSQYLH